MSEPVANSSDFSLESIAGLLSGPELEAFKVVTGTSTPEPEAAIVVREEDPGIEITSDQVLVVVAEPEDNITTTWGLPKVAVVPSKEGTKEQFRACLTGAYWEYLDSGTYTIEGIAKRAELNIPLTQRIVNSPEFGTAIRMRGVAVVGKGLTVEQDHCLQVILNPDGKTLDKKLKSLGLTPAKYRAWLKNPTFKAALERQAGEMLFDNSFSYVQLEALVNNGDINAIKYKHALNGTFNPNQQKDIDTQAFVTSVFKIISEEVKDGDTLRRIASRMQDLGTAYRNGATRTNDIIEGTVD